MQIEDRENDSKLVASLNGDGEAFINYRYDGSGTRVLTHTEVPEEAQGEGVGSDLARSAFDYLRQRDEKVIITCGYLKGWLLRHEDYRDVERS